MTSSIWLRLAALTALICAASPALAQTTRTWTGAVDNHWSVAGNWNPAGAPVDGDSLVFPPSFGNQTENDLAAGTAFAQIATGLGNILTGNSIELTESWTTNGGVQVNLPIDVAGNAVTFSGYRVTMQAELSGAGPVLVSGDLELLGTHSYSGVMTVQSSLRLYQADISQAALVLQGFLVGGGAVGSVDWTGGQIDLGLNKLDADNLTASGSGSGSLLVRVDGEIPGVSHGQLKVMGNVELGVDKAFYLSFGSLFAPWVGQELLLIDNDESDPISGSFLDLPEGSIINHNGARLLVSYAGGDGNDLSLTCLSVPRVWNGTVNLLWSEPGNWTPSGVPAAGEFLRFPSGAANLVTINDLPDGTAFSHIEFTGPYYTLLGNGVELTEALSGYFGTQVQLPIDVAANAVTISGSSTRLTGEISGTGPVLISGYLELSSAHSYSGLMTVQNNLDLDDADLSQASLLVQGYVGGSGVVGPVVLTSGAGIFLDIGLIQTGDLTATGSGSLSFEIDGEIPGVSHGQLGVTGGVDLGVSKTLYTAFGSSLVAVVGQELVLIDNDGSDPINGAFSGLPEGSIITHNGAELQLSYGGGDGNDLSLFVISAPRVWTGAVNGLWSEPNNWTPTGVPVAGDSLRFWEYAEYRTTINDLPAGIDFSRIHVAGSGYSLNGNAIQLSESFSSYYSATVNLPIDIGANAVTFSGSSTALGGELSGFGPVQVSSLLILSGAHSYSGSMAVQDNLFLDNADLSHAALVLEGRLSGSGVVGPVDWAAGGRIWAMIDRIDTGNLSASGTGELRIQIEGAAPGISQGQLTVAGSVDLGTVKTLDLYLGNDLVPIAGQELVLIDNDASDPIGGAFSNMPEGSIVIHNSAELVLSYVGGDGNDLSLTCISAPRVWNGTVNGLWSEPGNWTPAGVPLAGESLRFPGGVANLITTNDLPAGTAFSRLDIVGYYYAFNGNQIELIDSLFSAWSGNEINLPINVAGNSVTFSGSVTLAGGLSGAGPVQVIDYLSVVGVHPYAGTMTVQGTLDLDDAELSQATVVVEGYLQGDGVVGPVIWPGSRIAPDFGRIETGDLTASGSGTLSIALQGTMPGISHGQLRVAGAVDLGAGKHLSSSGGWNFLPALGHEWVLIDNDGSDAISGTFSGRPEGSTIALGGFSYRLSYIGGDGNDLSLTSLDGRTPTATSLMSSANPSQAGQWVTLTASVVGGGQTPVGEVIFRDGTVALGTVGLDVGGTAILSTSSLASGSHSITAEYLGGPNHGASASAPLIQGVGTFYSLTYSAGPNGILVGESPQQVFEGNDGSEVTAVPDLGYRFVQWSDASIANPRTDTDVTENLSVEAQFGIDPDLVDLEVAKDDGLQAALDGQEVVYAITVANAGLVAANGAQLSDVLPVELIDGEWACLPAESNTACPPSPFDAGTGDLYAEIDLPVGGFLRYDLSARIQAGSGATVSNTASIAPPAGLDDLAPGNNSATDSTLVVPQGIFTHGFESGPALLSVPGAAKAHREAAGGSQ